MPLTRLVHRVGAVGCGERTSFVQGRLIVSLDQARDLLADPALAGCRRSWGGFWLPPVPPS